MWIHNVEGVGRGPEALSALIVPDPATCSSSRLAGDAVELTAQVSTFSRHLELLERRLQDWRIGCRSRSRYRGQRDRLILCVVHIALLRAREQVVVRGLLIGRHGCAN